MAESTPDPSTTYTVNVAGSEYVLYTHSYLGFGQEQARARYNNLLKGPAVEDPCFQKGYSVAARSPAAADNLYDQYAGRSQGDFTGGGNFSACTSGMDELFTEVNPALRLAATCKTPPCAFGGVHQPRFWEGGHLASSLVLFENFFHSSHALNMPSGVGSAVTIEDFATEGRKWCSLAWSFVEKTGDAGSTEHGAYPQMEEEKEKKMCFSMAYMTSFLTALRIPSKFPMSIMGDIKATPLGECTFRLRALPQGWSLLLSGSIALLSPSPVFSKCPPPRQVSYHGLVQSASAHRCRKGAAAGGADDVWRAQNGRWESCLPTLHRHPPRQPTLLLLAASLLGLQQTPASQRAAQHSLGRQLSASPCQGTRTQGQRLHSLRQA